VAAVSVPDEFADILEKKGFAHVATLGPAGDPQTQPVWYKWDGESLSFSTIKRRQKYRNLARDSRIALSITDPESPHRNIELRGRAAIIDDPTGELINELSLRYTDTEFREADAKTERVIIRFAPDHVTTYGWVRPQ
jgi:PPOX class probable F420-dependent enzyme